MIQGTPTATRQRQRSDNSPAGLAAWIVEKFYEWSDCAGEVETRFTKDELLTNIMLYWTTQTIESSFQPYRDVMKAGALRWTMEAAKGWLGSIEDSGGFRAVPEGYLYPSARMGRTLLRRAELDRDAARRPFCRVGGAGALSRRYTSVFPATSAIRSARP